MIIGHGARFRAEIGIVPDKIDTWNDRRAASVIQCPRLVVAVRADGTFAFCTPEGRDA
jgi:hypothetical protein